MARRPYRTNSRAAAAETPAEFIKQRVKAAVAPRTARSAPEVAPTWLRVGHDRPKGKRIFGVAAVLDLLHTLKCSDIKAYDVLDTHPVCNYLVCVTASSRRQFRLVATSVVKLAREYRYLSDDPKNTIIPEGLDSDGWAIVDLGGLVVNVFLEEHREIYAEQVEVPYSHKLIEDTDAFFRDPQKDRLAAPQPKGEGLRRAAAAMISRKPIVRDDKINLDDYIVRDSESEAEAPKLKPGQKLTYKHTPYNPEEEARQLRAELVDVFGEAAADELQKMALESDTESESKAAAPKDYIDVPSRPSQRLATVAAKRAPQRQTPQDSEVDTSETEVDSTETEVNTTETEVDAPESEVETTGIEVDTTETEVAEVDSTETELDSTDSEVNASSEHHSSGSEQGSGLEEEPAMAGRHTLSEGDLSEAIEALLGSISDPAEEARIRKQMAERVVKSAEDFEIEDKDMAEALEYAQKIRSDRVKSNPTHIETSQIKGTQIKGKESASSESENQQRVKAESKTSSSDIHIDGDFPDGLDLEELRQAAQDGATISAREVDREEAGGRKLVSHSQLLGGMQAEEVSEFESDAIVIDLDGLDGAALEEKLASVAKEMEEQRKKSTEEASATLKRRAEKTMGKQTKQSDKKVNRKKSNNSKAKGTKE